MVRSFGISSQVWQTGHCAWTTITLRRELLPNRATRMTVSLSILQRKFKVVEARWMEAKGKMEEEEGWSSRLKYLSMEQFVIARRRPRYVKPISENLDAFSPAGSWSFLVEEAAHAAEGRRKWRSGDACRALTDWRAAGKLEWNWKKIGRWYRFRFRPFHVFRIFSIFLSQKKKKREKRLIDWLIIWNFVARKIIVQIIIIERDVGLKER